MKNAAILALLIPAVWPAWAQTANNHEGRTFQYGFEMRVRNEDWNNLFDFNDTLDDQTVRVRYRTRLWMKAPLSSFIDFHVGLNHETNQSVIPRKPYRFDELMFETAYLDFKRLFVKGLSLKVGRQNINKGEGFLLMDGSPGDGSRAFFYNAAVLGYERNRSRIELLAFNNPRTDRYLPRIHASGARSLVEWNGQAAGAYFTNASLRDTSIEGYYILTREVSDNRPKTSLQYQPDRRFSTAGGRVVRKLPRGFSWTGELAFQRGRQQTNTDLAARAGYTYVKKSFGGRGQHYLLAGYIGFSGDDPSTPGKIEGWSPMFGRWPKYSEMYLLSLGREKGAGYWSNLGMWQAELGYSPLKPVNVRFTYYRMDAFHRFPGNAATFGAGTVRGDMPQIRVDYTHNRNWKGHILYEYLNPGNFYSKASPAYFLRFEVIYTHTGSHEL